MFRIALNAAVVLLLSMLIMAPAQAERRVALVIGNSAYQHTGKLANPHNDATDLTRKLKKLGFEVTLGLDLTEEKFLDLISTFSATLKGAKVALLFYAGHGIQYQNVNYLIPIDAELKDEFRLKREAISLSDVVEQMESQVPVNLIFLDACRNNPLAEGLKRGLKSKGRSAFVGRGLARIQSSKNDTLIAFAAAPGAEAADGDGRNSPFTSALLKHIETPGVEVEVMLKRVTNDVQRMTKHTQAPERLSRLTSEFYFQPAKKVVTTPPPSVNPPPQPAPTGDSAREAWQVIRNTKSKGILKAFIKRFPNSVYATFAQVRIDEMTKVAAVPPGTGTGNTGGSGKNSGGSGNNSGGQQSGDDGRLPPAKNLSPGINGRNVKVVFFVPSDPTKAGSFRETSPGRWVGEDRSKKVQATFQELKRDAWSVYLQDIGSDKRFQLDLFTKEVRMRATASDTPRAVARIVEVKGRELATPPPPAITPAGVHGRNVVEASFGIAGQGRIGKFERMGVQRWVERGKNGNIRFNFVERARDEWSVFLFDPSRKVQLQLDLHRKEVKYSDVRNPNARKIYTIGKAHSKKIKVNIAVPATLPIEGQSWGGAIRSGPGTNFQRQGSLREGQRVTILENTGVEFNGFKWFKIRWNGRVAYQWGGILCPYGKAIPGTFKVCQPSTQTSNNSGQASGNRRLSCNAFGSIRSLGGGRQVQVTFVNRTNEHRSVQWINADGQPVDYAQLNPGQSFTILTAEKHPWMFTDGPGNCIEMFMPRAGQTRFNITRASPGFGDGND